jgi:hypothetical protein
MNHPPSPCEGWHTPDLARRHSILAIDVRYSIS